MKKMYRIRSREKEIYYHCISRVVAGDFLLGDEEKEVFRKMLWKISHFCGVEILTYCIMSNHVHLLCRVPPANSTLISDEEILKRYKTLFSNPSRYRPYPPELLEKWLKTNSQRGIEARENLLRRMHDVSKFMKILKHRFTIWFNQTHGRFGTLWAERFKSIVVEGRGNPLLTMAQYIDLNPVRASITTQTSGYRFSGFSEALAGNTLAINGICKIVSMSFPNLGRQECLSTYRDQLHTTLECKPPAPILKTPETEEPPAMRQDPRFSNSLAMGSREFISLLMEGFASAFSLRRLYLGPVYGGQSREETYYFGRQERKSSTRKS